MKKKEYCFCGKEGKHYVSFGRNEPFRAMFLLVCSECKNNREQADKKIDSSSQIDKL